MVSDTQNKKDYSDIGVEVADYSDIGVEVSEKPDYADIGTQVSDVPQFRQAPKENFIDTLKSFFRSPEEEIAKAQNVYAIARSHNLQLKDVYDNYDVMRKSSKITGLTPEMEGMEFIGLATIPAIATAAVLNPVGTAAGLVAFAALDKAIPTKEWMEKYEESTDSEIASGPKKAIEFIDFVGKGLIVGGVFKTAPELANKYLTQKTVEYNLPREIKLNKDQVRDIFQTGTLTSAEEKALFAGLQLEGKSLKKAISEGVNIKIPIEKITTLVDKPIWAKIKTAVGQKPINTKTVQRAGEPAVAPVAMLESKTAIQEFKPPLEEMAVLRDRPVTDKYQQNRQIVEIKRGPSISDDIQEFVDKTFFPISTRLGDIHPTLKDAIRRHAFKVNMSTKADMDSSLPFMKAMTKMEREDAIDLDFALKNGDDVIIDKIVAKYGIGEDYKKVRTTLEGIYNRAKSAGMDVGYIENYYPRRIIDTEKYLQYLRGTDNWGSISRAFQEERAVLGRDLKEEEKAEVINKMIRGFGKDKIPINRPNNIKERKIVELTPEMNAFYKDSGVALSEYIRSMNDNIEARVFFGKEKNLENSIGNYVGQLVDQQIISPRDEESVRQILKSYFEKRGTRGFITGFKNFSYIASMGQVTSAITQIGDLAFSLYRNGFYGTLKAATQKDKLTKQDIGLDIIQEEFTDQSRSSKAVSAVFKAVGLEAMDAFGKEVLINGAMNRLSSKASQNDPELTSTLKRVFGGKSDEVLSDLRHKVPTDDVKYMLFSELADFQPIALTEMPEYYVRGGNLRLFYMLKSYTIKQIDAFRNEVFKQKDPLKKMKNLVKLSAALALMGVTSDTIKDILLGRKTTIEDMAVDNMLKLVGFSKWQIYQSRQDGLFQTALQSILPPVPYLDDLYKDAMKFTDKSKRNDPDIEDLRIWQRIPGVGKFYYWWFGGGEEIKEKQEKKSAQQF